MKYLIKSKLGRFKSYRLDTALKKAESFASETDENVLVFDSVGNKVAEFDANGRIYSENTQDAVTIILSEGNTILDSCRGIASDEAIILRVKKHLQGMGVSGECTIENKEVTCPNGDKYYIYIVYPNVEWGA